MNSLYHHYPASALLASSLSQFSHWMAPKIYKCEEPDCGKFFTRPDEFTRHMSTHIYQTPPANSPTVPSPIQDQLNFDYFQKLSTQSASQIECKYEEISDGSTNNSSLPIQSPQQRDVIKEETDALIVKKEYEGGNQESTLKVEAENQISANKWREIDAELDIIIKKVKSENEAMKQKLLVIQRDAMFFHQTLGLVKNVVTENGTKTN